MRLFRVLVGRTPHLARTDESITLCGKTVTIIQGRALDPRRVKGATRCKACRRAADVRPSERHEAAA